MLLQILICIHKIVFIIHVICDNTNMFTQILVRMNVTIIASRRSPFIASISRQNDNCSVWHTTNNLSDIFYSNLRFKPLMVKCLTLYNESETGGVKNIT